MFPRKITHTVRYAMPAVVAIVITKNLADIEKEVPHELSHFYSGKGKGKKLAIPKSLIDEAGRVRIGGGSGFVVSADGLVLTNKHVVSDAGAEHTVILDNGKKYPAIVLCRDPINDVAILKIEARRLAHVKLGDAHRLELGEFVIAIGNALGLFKNTVSLGIISGLSRSVLAQADGGLPQEMRGLIQTDAAINLGNSGGPLMTLDGRVVGINTATIAGADGIGFAIPINAARRDLDDLHRYGRIRRPLLGVRYLTIDDTLNDKMHLGVSAGALVIHEGPERNAVIPGSPAEKSGLKEWDIILTYNGKNITTDQSLQDYLGESEAGDKVVFTVRRAGKILKLTATLTERT